MNNKCDGCKFYCNGRCFGEKDAPYVEYADCKGENNRPDTISKHNDFEEFAKFVAYSIFEDDFEEDPGWFVEVACRKLVKLGIVKLSEDKKEYSIEVNDMRGEEYEC